MRAIKSSRVLVDGKLVEATVVIDNGKIQQIVESPSRVDIDVDVVDYGQHVIIPGLVDAHVHLNEPGRTEWEGFETGTKAAAFGGVTTVVDMPLNAIPPTTTVENLKIKKQAAQGQMWVNVGFWGGVVPNNQDELVPLINEGVRGFKCFLIESGVDEFPMVSEKDVLTAMSKLEGHETVLMFHAEKCECEHNVKANTDASAYSTFLDSRPQEFEIDAITDILHWADSFPNLRLHIVHLASGQAGQLVDEARHGTSPKNITAETCFHYLALNSEAIPNGATMYKCCPPIREQSNQSQLWRLLENDTISMIVSDHSPCTPDLKLLTGQTNQGDFMQAWGGISSVGLGLCILWTEAQTRGISIEQLVKWTSENTAKHAGLDKHKGSIAVGKDADFCIFDPQATWVLDQSKMQFKNKVTPYHNKELVGQVIETIVGGTTVYSLENGFSEPAGTFV